MKRITPRPIKAHADYGCNSEVYCGNEFIELETLGPLARLEPGQTAEHEETWEVYAGVSEPVTREGVRSLVGRLGLITAT